MIFEYALEPEVLSKPENVRYFLEQFDVHKGRLIADYPKKWASVVYRMWAPKLMTMEGARFRQLLESLSKKVLERETTRTYEGSVWLENAERIQNNGREPFRAIVAKENPRSHPAVLVAEAVNELSSLWHVKRQDVVERKARALADVAAPLILISKQILLIDPYFDPCERTFQSSLKALLYPLGYRRARPGRLELHCCVNPKSSQTFWSDCLTELPEFVPHGISLSVVRWKLMDGGERFHRRYVLTERGGIAFEGGLDRGKEGQTTDVYLLESELRDTRWKEYQPDSTVFEKDEDGPIQVVGKWQI